jgi:catechol 2,3-dioxygenase-like lactoylglutathione lyase family enzyme
MKAHYLGHVVFYVKDLEQSLAFYRDLLGFQEVGRIFNGAAAAGSIISVSKSAIIWMNFGRPSGNWSKRVSRSTA